MKVALTVGGSDAGGGAGIQADLKSFHTAGVHGTSAITAITAQNTQGVHRIYPLPREEIAAQLDAILDDMDVGAAKTGMLYTSDVAELAAEKLSDVKLVVDPVLVSTTRHSLSTTEHANAIATHLLPVCTLVTPNIDEAAQLTDMSIENLDDVRNACRALHGLGAKAVVVTGGHLDEATDIFYDGRDFTALTLPKQQHAAHGSGCTFSAYITAFLARGLSMQKAVELAKRYTWTAVAGATTPGKGVDVVWQQATRLPVMNGDRTRVWHELQQAVDDLLTFLPCSLLPEVGINLAYALPGASSREDVCAVEGRITYAGRPVQVGECRFGASQHIAAIVLAAMQHDTGQRSAMNLAYSEKAVHACRSAGLTTGSFDRADEPAGRSTMEWGTGHVIEQLGEAPDVIWDTGGVGKEAMIRVIGEAPRQVLQKVQRITAALEKD